MKNYFFNLSDGVKFLWIGRIVIIFVFIYFYGCFVQKFEFICMLNFVIVLNDGFYFFWNFVKFIVNGDFDILFFN